MEGTCLSRVGLCLGVGCCCWLGRGTHRAAALMFSLGPLQGENGQELKGQLQTTFRNITQIMNCVGCEKCKLWGKLQILGMGTALRILFDEDGAGVPMLNRNEVIALINFMGRLSSSVEAIREMTELVASGAAEHVALPPESASSATSRPSFSYNAYVS